MKKTFRFTFSVLLILVSLSSYAQDADTVKAAKALSIGFDVTGPLMYAIDNSGYNYEAYLSYRLNYKYFLVAEPGIASFGYNQYNYEYVSDGFFLRVGTDISMLAPVASKIDHYAGIGLRYGLSLFRQETPSISIDNYWGQINTAIPENRVNAHFLELQGSVKSEVFRNFLIGWAVKLRTLIYSSGKNGKKPVYIPGMGNNSSLFTTSISYYIIYRFPLKASPAE